MRSPSADGATSWGSRESDSESASPNSRDADECSGTVGVAGMGLAIRLGSASAVHPSQLGSPITESDAARNDEPDAGPIGPISRGSASSPMQWDYPVRGSTEALSPTNKEGALHDSPELD